MNELDLLRKARPDVASLSAQEVDDICAAVFGDVADRQPTRSHRRLYAVLAAATIAAAAVVAFLFLPRSELRTLSPAAPTREAPSTSQVAETAAPTTTVEDWHQQPNLRFRPTDEWFTLFEQAREAKLGRCMVAAGFEYHGNPYETDTALANAAADIQAGSYEAAFYGVGGLGGGCLDQAYATVFGPERADVDAENVRSSHQGAWQRSAFAEPALRRGMNELAVCARAHGMDVRDAPDRLDRVFNDVLLGIQSRVLADPRADAVPPEAIAEARQLFDQIADELCPTFSSVQEQVATGTVAAEVAWIQVNPVEMANIDAEIADDIARFNYIIEHHGELPPE